MTLPYDYARCSGTTYPVCQSCRRREPGRDTWQAFILPAVSLTGECPNHIGYQTAVAAGTGGASNGGK